MIEYWRFFAYCLGVFVGAIAFYLLLPAELFDPN